ncbi:MAG: alkaline phosphatase family protein [Actinomycetaceae bacterium]|nr:alkaline phosphatase family protein [Actinomycetaceae bacterium]MDY6083088.1 alkaline phosphatase family protein [Actinomycetaceae bacterium]
MPVNSSEPMMRTGSRNLTMVISASLDAVGIPSASHSSTSAADRTALGIPSSRRIVCVLVDGLGALNLADRIGHAPTLRSFQQMDPMTSVVPSTTAAAITAAGTGELPGATAMLSYQLRAPESRRSFSLIAWNDETVSPRAWQSVPTLFESLDAPDRARVSVVQPADFIGSGLTEAALRGAPALAAESLEDRVAASAHALRQGKDFVYLYWGDVDHAGHSHGWESERWTAELERLDSALRQLAHMVPRDTTIVLTADHGMVDVPVEHRIDIARHQRLAADIELTSGEERGLQLYLKPGVDPDVVASRYREELGDRSWVFTQAQAIDSGLFGDVSPFARSVLGDVLVFQRADWALTDSRFHVSHSVMRGVHGSLTAREMLIPLLIEVV